MSVCPCDDVEIGSWRIDGGTKKEEVGLKFLNWNMGVPRTRNSIYHHIRFENSTVFLLDSFVHRLFLFNLPTYLYVKSPTLGST